MVLARNMSFQEMLQLVTSNSNAFSRVQTPMKNFIKSKLMLNDTITIEEAVIRLIDDNFELLKSLETVASVNEDVDLPESMSKYLTERVLAICMCILNYPEDEVAPEG